MVDISCLCLTHGRPYWLREAVESFRRQDLGGLTAEMIIINDCQEQTLTCSVPGVVISQGVPQFTDISDKYNYAADMARGRWFAFWDDDDIHLPDHLRWTLAQLERRPDAGAIRPMAIWNWANGTIRGIASATLCQAMVHADAWHEVGGCTPGEWCDKSLKTKLVAAGMLLDVAPSGPDTHYIYRWDGIGHHDSGSGEQDPAIRSAAFHQAALADPRFVAGRVDVVPQWGQDYVALKAAALKRKLDRVRV